MAKDVEEKWKVAHRQEETEGKKPSSSLSP